MGRRTGAAGTIGIAATAIGLLAAAAGTVAAVITVSDGAAGRHAAARPSPRTSASSRSTSRAGEVVLAASDETRMRGRYGLWFDHESGHARLGDVIDEDDRLVRRRLDSVDFGRLERADRGRIDSWYHLGPVGARPRVRERRRRDAARPGAGLGRPGGGTVDPVGHPGARARREAPGGPARRRAGTRRRLEHPPHLLPQRRRGARERGSPVRARRHGVGRRRGRRALRGGARRRAHRADGLVDGRRDRAAGRPALGRGARAPRGRHPRLARHRLGGHPPLPGAGARPAAGSSATWSSRLLGGPFSGGLTGVAAPIDVEDLDPVARADELDVPILLMHSVDDGFVPIDGSRRLAAARPDLIEFEVFEGARHTKLWNHDPERWTGLVARLARAQRGRRGRLGDEAEIVG